jgi:hypothetical protein
MCNGNASAALDGLAPHQRPAMGRGDCGFGNAPFIVELETRTQPYLFKLRQTKGIHKLLQRQFQREDWTQPSPTDQGWSAVEDTVKLSGWDQARRVVILRRVIKEEVALTRKIENQLNLWLKDEATLAYEYAVLVTNTSYDVQAIAQLYRDRVDCENGFDELKNPWGWGGFTTQDIERCQTSARSVALVYNWWRWYCRAAKPDGRMEAITSRPLLLAGVGRAVKHAGQSTLYLTAMHAAGQSLISLITNIRTALAYVKTIAEPLPTTDLWHTLLNYIVAKITQRSPPVYAQLFAVKLSQLPFLG